ncbi:MAG: 1-(5-phosphoribosyl)-5-[(5-phosphoribosylamino)methylideneamino]imidazole-4-carboxamide isomerase [Anaerolineae bacterium]
MIVYPAIDLRNGHCVRLQQGKFESEVIFASDPCEAAQRWTAEGAEWLHIVNLDGALNKAGQVNLDALKRILGETRVPIQFGGGLRNLDDIDYVLKLGVARVVLGTVALQRPEVVAQAVATWGADKVAVGIDARAGIVAVQGWTENSSVLAEELAIRLKGYGIERVIFTDIARDGMLMGVNILATANLAKAAGLRVIASGGVASLSDIVTLSGHEADGVEGVIIGMALYRGAITLGDALKAARGECDAS